MALVIQVVDFLAFVGFWLLQGFPAVADVVRAAGFGPVWTGVLYIFLLGLLGQVISMPFSV